MKKHTGAQPGNKNRLGRGLTAPEATEHPSVIDIGWLAGLFEGEGCVSGNAYYGSFSVEIYQQDPWVLHRVQAFVGGSVKRKIFKEHHHHRGDDYMYRWIGTGPRGRGFLMMIYKFLSPRRKQQVLKALNSNMHPITKDVVA